MKNAISVIITIFIFGFSVTAAQDFVGMKQINGNGIFCRMIGKGEPIIVLHGGPGLGHDYMLKQYAQLAENYKLIFFDQRGCGLSDEFKNNEKVTVDDMVEDIEGVRKEFNAGKIYLAGSSWGAILAIKYTIKYPDNVKRLLLMEPAPGSTEYLPAFLKSMRERLNDSDKAEVKKLESDPNVLTDAEIYKKALKIRYKAYYYDVDKYDPKSLDYMDSLRVKKDIESSNMFNPYLGNFNLYEDMKKIKCPLLIIHGDYDPIPTESVEKMKEYAKQAELHIIKNCGHFVFIEKEKEYFDLIKEFLQSLVKH